MEFSVFVLILFSAIGILGVFYCLHFRYRAMVMGPERLRSALSRTVSGEEGAPDQDLREGLEELKSRLRRAIAAASLLFMAISAACIAMAVSSTLPELALALSGVGVLLAAVIASLMLLRDILRFLSRHLEETAGDQPDS